MSEREIVFVERDRVELRATRRPDEPLAADEVEGRTLVTLLSVGTELAMLGGLFEYPFPLEPGYAAAFEVERAGDGVGTLAPGDVAFTMGTHRSFQRAPEADVVRVPDGLVPELAVFCRMAAVPWTALATTAARPPERVWILGLGLVGHLAARIFAASGYAVMAYDPLPERRDLMTGADGIAVVAEVDETEKAALVVECSGRTESVVTACNAVRAGGEVILVGGPWRTSSDVDAATLHRAIYRNYVVLRSGWEWQLPTLRQGDGRPSMLGNMEAALDWLRGGRLEVPAAAYDVSPPDAAVYARWASGTATGLTTLFDWRAS